MWKRSAATHPSTHIFAGGHGHPTCTMGSPLMVLVLVRRSTKLLSRRWSSR